MLRIIIIMSLLITSLTSHASSKKHKKKHKKAQKVQKVLYLEDIEKYVDDNSIVVNPTNPDSVDLSGDPKTWAVKLPENRDAEMSQYDREKMLLESEIFKLKDETADLSVSERMKRFGGPISYESKKMKRKKSKKAVGSIPVEMRENTDIIELKIQ